ncbi:hypothetical protein PPIS_a2685 [Pseudoalteromonas piscicida]|uniref:Uncharacterized protein n=1 Tax=Pseudoalteromonas piscicida TaxID=43662 RepID=A0ABN5CDH4_PSEO7|nr:hypothetical protein PPIS_a2685 [Pseudoalteromonas piscicida]
MIDFDHERYLSVVECKQAYQNYTLAEFPLASMLRLGLVV